MKKFKRLSVLVLAVILAMNCFATTAFAATTMGYNAVATTSSSTYEDNAPINRVFYVKTGSSSASRTLKFEQTAGEISYYMYRNTTKNCYQKYRIFVFNNGTKKVKEPTIGTGPRAQLLSLTKRIRIILFSFTQKILIPSLINIS